MAGIAALGVLLAPGGSSTRRLAAVVALILAGAWRAGTALGGEMGEGPLAAYRQQVVTVRGSIDRPPRCGTASCLFVVRVEAIEAGSGVQTLGALVQIRTTVRQDLGYGRPLEARGELRAPRAVTGFPRVELLARQGILDVMDFPRLRVGAVGAAQEGVRFEALRAALEQRLAAAVHGPEGQLASGLLLGRDVVLSPELRADLRTTGTSHITAVSGANVAIAAGLVFWVALRLVSRPWAAALATLVVLGYTLLVGAPPSATRAALMFGVATLAMLVGRLPDPLTALVLAAGVMTAVDPSLVLDLGFQLSFAATAGLVVVGPRLPRLRGRLLSGLVGAGGLTLAAELATLPLVLHTFHSLSVVAPLTNVLITPLIPATMALGAANLLVADLPLIGPAASGATWLMSHMALEIIGRSADLPFAAIATGSLPAWAVGGAYACLLLPFALPPAARRLGWSGRARWQVAGGLSCAAGLVAMMILASARTAPSPTLRARFFDVAGDALTMLETSSGRRVLIGSAGSPLAANALAELLPLVDRSIDLLIVTRAGERDLDGLGEIVRRYPVGQVVEPPSGLPERAGRWSDALRQAEVPRTLAQPGLAVELDGLALVVEDIVTESGDRPASLTVRVLSDVLDLRVVGAGIGSPPAETRAVVVRLAAELGLSRELRQRLAPAGERLVVIGGRAGGEAEPAGTRLRLGGGEIVELVDDGSTVTVRRLLCSSGADGCAWTWSAGKT